jgi:O-antigen ligase
LGTKQLARRDIDLNHREFEAGNLFKRARSDGSVDGLIWTLLVWGVAVVVIAPQGVRGFLKTGRVPMSRERIAIVLALLGTHTFAPVTTGAEVLANPIVLERVVRGVLSVLSLVVIFPVLLERSRSSATQLGRGLTAVVVYGIVALVSTLYSISALVTGAKVLELAAGLVVVIAVAMSAKSGAELRRLIEFVVLLEAALVVGAMVGYVAVPEFFQARVWRPGFILRYAMVAPYNHSNELSASAALVAAYSLATVFTTEGRRQKRYWLALFIFTTAGLMLASGRQGLIMWMASVLIILWVLRRRILVLLVGPAAVVAYFLYSDAFWTAFVRNQPEQLANLSDRTLFWQAAYDAWLRHPWTGYGYGAGGRFVALEVVNEGQITSLHSGYMEALVGVGLLGLLPLAYAVFRATGWALRALRDRVDVPIAILMVPLVLHASVSLGFAAWLTADFVVFGSIVALADLHEASRRRQYEPVGRAGLP